MALTDDQEEQIKEYLTDNFNSDYIDNFCSDCKGFQEALLHIHFHTYLGLTTINENIEEIRLIFISGLEAEFDILYQN